MAAHCRARITALAVIAVLVGIVRTAPALADTDAGRATRWGLIGTWTNDCAQPPSRSNVYLSYIVSGDKIIHQRDYGDGRDAQDVLSVKAMPDGVELQVFFQDSQPPAMKYFEIVPSGNRYHVKYNHDQAGAYTVKDFRIVATGQPAAWLVKCR